MNSHGMDTPKKHLDYLLTAYLFESISDAGRREVEAHLEACPECRTELERLRTTLGALKGALGKGAEEAGSLEGPRLEKVLRTRPVKGFGRWLLEKRSRIALAAAAVVVVGLVIPALYQTFTLRYMSESAPAPGIRNAARYAAPSRSNAKMPAPASKAEGGREGTQSGLVAGGQIHDYLEDIGMPAPDPGGAGKPAMLQKGLKWKAGTGTGTAAVAGGTEKSGATSLDSRELFDEARKEPADLAARQALPEATEEEAPAIVEFASPAGTPGGRPTDLAVQVSAERERRTFARRADMPEKPPGATSARADVPPASEPAAATAVTAALAPPPAPAKAAPATPAAPLSPALEETAREVADLSLFSRGDSNFKVSQPARGEDRFAGRVQHPIDGFTGSGQGGGPGALGGVQPPDGSRRLNVTDLGRIPAEDGVASTAGDKVLFAKKEADGDRAPPADIFKDDVLGIPAVKYRLNLNSSDVARLADGLEPQLQAAQQLEEAEGERGGLGVNGPEGADKKTVHMLGAIKAPGAPGAASGGARRLLAESKEPVAQPGTPVVLNDENFALGFDPNKVQAWSFGYGAAQQGQQAGGWARGNTWGDFGAARSYASIQGLQAANGWFAIADVQGKPLQISLRDLFLAERRLRAFRYWRALDTSLNLERFAARELSVPPPTVGDEGLGEEGFRKRYGVNPFVDTERDHLSTFGMDVDTASYTLARNMLRSGKLPDPKTVRVEEFVNYFREDCPADPERAFSVFCEGGPSPFREGLELLKIAVKARELRAGERKSAVLTFAVDTSGSMASPAETKSGTGAAGAGSRLFLVKQALRTLVNSLESEDRVGIVAYSASPYLVLPHAAAREKERILGAIDSLAAGGATNVEAGLDLAYRVADEVFQEKAVNRVLLCSDGVANAGARGPEDILKKVEVFARRGIYLSSVGFGMGRYNDSLLETLADKGNGNYAYVDTVAEAERIFRENLPATLQVLAQDAKIQVDFNAQAVSHYRLLGYEKRDIADKDFRNDKVDAGEVGPGTTVTVLYEIRRKVNPAGDLGRIYLRYRDTGTGRVDEVNYALSPGVLATALKETSERFRFVACVAECAELLRESYWSRGGSFGKVLSMLQTMGNEFRARPEWKDFADLALRAQAIQVATLAGK